MMAAEGEIWQRLRACSEHRRRLDALKSLADRAVRLACSSCGCALEHRRAGRTHLLL